MTFLTPFRHRPTWLLLALWLVVAQCWAIAHDDTEHLGDQHRCSLCHHHHQHQNKALHSSTTPPPAEPARLAPHVLVAQLLRPAHELVLRARGPPLL
ncbi:hypothetical protein [Gallaecimonas pentaromativorans]|uniref:hypothetical protein n=1 Tax=Gallaecimonas pentaromativorans TaxID=584787 RepID=UPI003A8D6866